jgi:hypothetical protein
MSEVGLDRILKTLKTALRQPHSAQVLDYTRAFAQWAEETLTRPLDDPVLDRALVLAAEHKEGGHERVEECAYCKLVNLRMLLVAERDKR